MLALGVRFQLTFRRQRHQTVKRLSAAFDAVRTTVMNGACAVVSDLGRQLVVLHQSLASVAQLSLAFAVDALYRRRSQ